LLKALFRRGYFDTPAAMKRLGLREPEASRIDHWRTAPGANRLLATRLPGRFPLPDGRGAAAAAVGEARAINTDLSCSSCVTAVFLFGSVMAGDEAGGVDLAVKVGRRALPPEAIRRSRPRPRRPATALPSKRWSGPSSG
jgi:hypothetical protein